MTRSNITQAKLVERLLELRGSTFLTMSVTTDARLKKKGHDFGIVYKTKTVNCQVNFHYDTAVINRLKKEGKDESVFERGESWHQPFKVDGKLTPFSTKKGETTPSYLRVRHIAILGEPIYTKEDGSELSVEELQPFLPKDSEYSNQGTDDPVEFKVYKLDSIRFIKFNGEEFLIV